MRPSSVVTNADAAHVKIHARKYDGCNGTNNQ